MKPFFPLFSVSFRVIGQPGGGGAVGAGNGWLGDARRGKLSLLRYAGSADGGTPVAAETPGSHDSPGWHVVVMMCFLFAWLTVAFSLCRCEAEERLGHRPIRPLPLYGIPAEGGGASQHAHPESSLLYQEALCPATDPRVSMATKLG